MTKLDSGMRHLMRLASRDADLNGWATVSDVVFPLLEGMPRDLIEIQRHDDGGGHARLTDIGIAVLKYT